jgi:hypothetical protein
MIPPPLRFDIRPFATLNIACAEAPIVGQQLLHATWQIWQSSNHFGHRLDLLPIGGRLRLGGRRADLPP